MNEENLIKYYNKFNEDKRLTRRHGIVEYTISMKYILKYLEKFDNPKIIDIGAGTGKYSISLHNLGYNVTGVELIKHNLKTLQKNCNQFPSYQGNALDLKRFKDETFDVVILFGPMYHLISFEEKIRALKEAKRILKKDGIIFISYYMNDYAVIKHGFIEGNIMKSINDKEIDKKYHVTPKNTDLYSMVRLEDIKKLSKEANLKRIQIVSQDGPTDYIRNVINNMDDEMFKEYIDYVYSISNRKELLGASSHVLDILKKTI